MVDGSADDRQAQGDVDRSAEALEFEHRQPLVVIHGQHRVAVLEVLRGKQGVSR